MHGLPSDFDGAFMVGRTLELVGFAENQVTLHFDERLRITIESAYSYRDVRTELPVETSNLMQLLGASVTEARADRDGSLRLEFDNGETLTVHETGPQFESFQIAYAGNVIVV